MKIKLSYVVGMSLGNLASCIFVSESPAIQFFNTLCILLISIYIYIIQNETKAKDIE